MLPAHCTVLKTNLFVMQNNIILENAILKTVNVQKNNDKNIVPAVCYDRDSNNIIIRII